MDRRAAYRALCAAEPSIPLFARDWWLDAACSSDGWDVVLSGPPEQPSGALPFAIRKRLGLTLLGQPPLTQFLGPWIRPTGAKNANDLARQKDVMSELIDALPPFAAYAQSWSPTITNWLPFRWRGFEQTTYYTYQLETADEQANWGGLRENIRREIRKARDRFGITVDAEASFDDFMRLAALTYQRQGKPLPYDRAIYERIEAACASRGARRIFIAQSADGQRHAGAYIVWGEHTAYYLFGGGDPALRNSGATSLALWEAIRFSSRIVPTFDFEGSMVEPIERVFRSFGATQTPYFHVSRTNSRVLQASRMLRELVATRPR